MIGLLIVTVVALIALAAKNSKSHGHSGGGHGSGGHAVGAGMRPGRVFTASRGIEHVHRHTHTAATVLDAFGRTAVDIALATPDWGENPQLPREGGQSQMYLEMTLVDNRTGLALWHARQTFPANAASASDTARVARTMMALLPPRASLNRSAPGAPQSAAP